MCICSRKGNIIKSRSVGVPCVRHSWSTDAESRQHGRRQKTHWSLQVRSRHHLRRSRSVPNHRFHSYTVYIKRVKFQQSRASVYDVVAIDTAHTIFPDSVSFVLLVRSILWCLLDMGNLEFVPGCCCRRPGFITVPDSPVVVPCM